MVAVVPGPIAPRASRLGWMAAGGVAGVAVTGGWWYWHMAQSTGNPLFPYYNDIFQSPLYWNQRFVFSYFLPTNAVEAIFYPWIWLADTARVSEMRFVDLTMPALMTLGVCGGLARALGLRPLGQTTPHPALRALAAFWVVGYVLWLTQSSVYRFAVVLEMTAPLLIVAWLSRWVPPRQLGVRIVAVLVPIMVVTWPANFGRYAFADRYVATTPVERRCRTWSRRFRPRHRSCGSSPTCTALPTGRTVWTLRRGAGSSVIRARCNCWWPNLSGRSHSPCSITMAT
jgi:hypothetical protein